MDIWSNPLILIVWNAHNGNSCHATSSRNASYFPSLLARVEPGSTSPRMAPLTNLVSESERAQVHFMDAGRRPNRHDFKGPLARPCRPLWFLSWKHVHIHKIEGHNKTDVLYVSSTMIIVYQVIFDQLQMKTCTSRPRFQLTNQKLSDCGCSDL